MKIFLLALLCVPLVQCGSVGSITIGNQPIASPGSITDLVNQIIPLVRRFLDTVMASIPSALHKPIAKLIADFQPVTKTLQQVQPKFANKLNADLQPLANTAQQTTVQPNAASNLNANLRPPINVAQPPSKVVGSYNGVPMYTGLSKKSGDSTNYGIVYGTHGSYNNYGGKGQGVKGEIIKAGQNHGIVYGPDGSIDIGNKLEDILGAQMYDVESSVPKKRVKRDGSEQTNLGDGNGAVKPSKQNSRPIPLPPTSGQSINTGKVYGLNGNYNNYGSEYNVNTPKGHRKVQP